MANRDIENTKYFNIGEADFVTHDIDEQNQIHIMGRYGMALYFHRPDPAKIESLRLPLTFDQLMAAQTFATKLGGANKWVLQNVTDNPKYRVTFDGADYDVPLPMLGDLVQTSPPAE
jgi:hypothetical protein